MAETAGLYWEQHGRADAPPLILSSGLGGSAHYWKANIPALAQKYRVIAYDHRGTGRSDRTLTGRVTVETMADDVVALMNGIGIERAHMIGHAAGGLIGLSMALGAPERIDRLVVVNGWARLDPHFARCFDTRMALLRDSGPRAYIRAQPIFLYPSRWISDHTAEIDAEEEKQFDDFPGIDTVSRRVAALRSFRIDDRMHRIRTPILAVAADDDMLVPAPCSEALAEGIPSARLGLFATGGHACNITQPDQFNRLVMSWLASG